MRRAGDDDGDGMVIALLRVNCFGRFDSVETRRWTSRAGERRRVIPSGNR